MNISVIITNWNGKEVLEKTLPTIIEAVHYDSNNNYELILVDDFSTDGSADFVKKNFSEVIVYRTDKNIGYINASNYGVGKAKHPFVVFLNSDMKVAKDFFRNITSEIVKRESIFAVTPAVYDWNGNFLYGNRGGRFENGHLYLFEKDEKDVKSQTFFACGGAFIFRKNIYLNLGGYDNLFHPFYYEEIDISYRALKRGYEIIYLPDAKAYHKVRASISKSRYFNMLRYISGRNNYLFLWKNITDLDLVFSMIIFQPLYLLRDLFRLKFRFWVCFLWALVYFPKAIVRKYKEKRYFKYSDKEIFEKICG